MSKPFIAIDLDDTAIISKKHRPADEMKIELATFETILSMLRSIDRWRNSDEEVYNAGTKTYIDEMEGFGNKSVREIVLPLYEGIEQKLGQPAEQILGLSRREFAVLLHEIRRLKVLELIKRDKNYPLFHQGFEDFYLAIISGDINADVAIVTSNHHEVVQEIFRKVGLPVPTNIVSQDTILSYPGLLPFEKPSAFSMIVAEAQRRGIRLDVFELYGLIKSFRAKNTLMIGNDPERDGGTAYAVRATFGFCPFTHPGFKPEKAKGQFPINDFVAFKDYLAEVSLRATKEGRPFVFAEAIFGRKERELFPEGHFRGSPEREF